MRLAKKREKTKPKQNTKTHTNSPKKTRNTAELYKTAERSGKKSQFEHLLQFDVKHLIYLCTDQHRTPNPPRNEGCHCSITPK